MMAVMLAMATIVTHAASSSDLIPVPRISTDMMRLPKPAIEAPEVLQESVINGVTVRLERGNIVTDSGVQRMVYTRFGNDIVLEGDIKVQTPQSSAFSFGVPAIQGIFQSPRRWPDAVIPYEEEPGFCCAAMFDAARAAWEDTTPVRFVPRSDEEDFVRLENQGPPPLTSWSTGSGMQGGQMTVKIQSASLSTDNNGDGTVDATDTALATAAITSTMIHELGHVIGLMHEHTRPDRDEFLLRNDNCQGDLVDAWIEFTNSGINNEGVLLGEYDFRSVMHYNMRVNDNTATSATNDSCSLYFRRDSCVPEGDFNSSECVANFRASTPTAKDINGIWMMYGEELGSNGAADRFGHVLLTRDINEDGYDDLVVGAPGDKLVTDVTLEPDGLLGTRPVFEYAAAGRVYLYRGSDRGLLPWMRITPPEPKEGMEFGYALAFIDDSGSRGNSHGRLAIGAPGELLAFRPAAGAVYLVDINETEPGNLERLTKDGFFFAGLQEAGDRFGHALAVGNFRVNGEFDLAIGAPGARHSAGVENEPRAGAVFMLQNMTKDPNVGGGARMQLLDTELSGRGRIGNGLASIRTTTGRDWLVVTAPGTRFSNVFWLGYCGPKALVVSGAPSTSFNLNFSVVDEIYAPPPPDLPVLPNIGRPTPCLPVVGDVPADQDPTRYLGAGFGRLVAAGDMNRDGYDEIALSGLSHGDEFGEVAHLYQASSTGYSYGATFETEGGTSLVGAMHFADYDADDLEDLFIGLPGQIRVAGYDAEDPISSQPDWVFSNEIANLPVSGIDLDLSEEDYYAGAISFGDYRKADALSGAFGLPGVPDAEKPRSGVVLISEAKNQGQKIIKLVHQETDAPYAED